MKVDNLVDWLRSVGVPPEVVSIGAEADDAWCLIRDDGMPGEQAEVAWEVFWREQGNRYDWARFTNEQVACFYLFGRLTWTQAARRKITVRADDAPPAPQQPPAPAGPPAMAPPGMPGRPPQQQGPMAPAPDGLPTPAYPMVPPVGPPIPGRPPTGPPRG